MRGRSGVVVVVVGCVLAGKWARDRDVRTLYRKGGGWTLYPA